MPTFIANLVLNWSAVYSTSAVLRTLVAFVHIAGLVGGGGAAIVADRATLIATRRGTVVRREALHSIHNTHRIVLIGLAAVMVSGMLLFAADVETYAASKVFWLKMAMIAGLMVNGTVLVRAAGSRREHEEWMRRTLRWTAAISLALWFLTTLAGAGLPNI